MQNKKLGFGIIGCGVIADFHANALFELSDSAEIIGVADVNYDAAEKFANRHGIKAFSNPQELLACADVDIVNICTPSGYHASCVEEAAKAGTGTEVAVSVHGGRLYVRSDAPLRQVRLVAMDGTTAALFRPSGNAAACDVSALGRGVYAVVCQTEEGRALQVKKLVLK